MKKSFISAVVVAIFLVGCGTISSTPKTPNINTYNTSSGAKNNKSTLGYPGSKDQKQPTPEGTQPYTPESTTITSTAITAVDEKPTTRLLKRQNKHQQIRRLLSQCPLVKMER